MAFLSPSLHFFANGGTRARSIRTPLICSQQKTDETKPLISVRDVSLWWPNGRAGLQDVNLDVYPGELTMILGPNGCGKSTLLRVIRGLLIPPKGSVSFESPCAYVRQNPSEQIIMPSVGTDIAFSIPNEDKLPKEEVQAKVISALETVGLEPAAKIAKMSSHRLSGGQKQRAVVAAALAMEPKTILFDEVTASIDPLNKAELVSRVRNIVSERKLAAMWYVIFFFNLFFT